ncbi:hypothetical protein MTO96_040157, partial [Rhipicephalus appendiculatus]
TDQVPDTKDKFLKVAGAAVKDAKAALKKFGDDLGDKDNLFYIELFEYPEELNAKVNKRFGKPYRYGCLAFFAHESENE